MGKATHQSAPLSMVSEQAAPKAAKSAERIEGAMIAGGVMAFEFKGLSKGDLCY